MKPTPMSWEVTKESASIPLADTPTTISYTDINNFEIPNKRPRKPIPVYYNGVTYESQCQCAQAFGIDRSKIRLRMKKVGCTFAEALDYFIKKREEDAFVDCLGVKHKNLSEAVRYYRVNYQRVVNYAEKHGITGSKNILDTLLQNPEDYEKLTTPLKSLKAVPVTVNGKHYPTLSSCYADLGLTESAVNYYIRTYHMTVEEAVNVCLTKKEEKIKGKTAKPTADNPSLPSTTFDATQTAEKQEVNVELNVEQFEYESESEFESAPDDAPSVTLTIQPSAQETTQSSAQSSAQPIFELADEPRGRDLMIELLDLWTNLLRKHWLGEELMCDEWRENFREFEADMLALGYATATQVTRSNTNRMWRKDNITVK